MSGTSGRASSKTGGPSPFSIALFVSDDQGWYTEVTGDGYTRYATGRPQGVASWQTGGWGTVTHWGVYDSAGNCLSIAPFDGGGAITVAAGDTINLSFSIFEGYNLSVDDVLMGRLK